MVRNNVKWFGQLTFYQYDTVMCRIDRWFHHIEEHQWRLCWNSKLTYPCEMITTFKFSGSVWFSVDCQHMRAQTQINTPMCVSVSVYPDGWMRDEIACCVASAVWTNESISSFHLYFLFQWLFLFLTDSVSIKFICFSRVSFVNTHFSSPTPSMDAHWIWFGCILSRFVYGFLLSILFLLIFLLLLFLVFSSFSIFDEIDALKFTVVCCCYICARCTFHKI